MPEDNVLRMLPKNDLRVVIRAIRRGSPELAAQVCAVAEEQLERLGAEPDENQAWQSTPDGSDQLEPLTWYRWMEQIEPANRKAIKQLVAIHATAKQRIK